MNNWKDFPVVVKASGLAAGKGVIIAQNLDEAIKAVDDIMIDEKFGDAGNQSCNWRIFGWSRSFNTFIYR